MNARTPPGLCLLALNVLWGCSVEEADGPDVYDAERVGREMELTFANAAGDKLALRRGDAGEIALADGRRARVALGTAREFQPGEDPDRPPMNYSFLLTLTP